MSELTYEMRRALRRDVGPQAAAVIDVLAHYDTGDGTGAQITAHRLATESGLSEKTVRRVLSRLSEAGLVNYDNQFRDNRQLANRYYPQYDRIGGGQSDPPGGQDDRAIVVIAIQEVVEVATSNPVVNEYLNQ